MAWQFTGDVEAYLAAAGGFLRANAVRNTIMLGVAGALQARGPAAFGDAAPLYGWWTEPDGTVGAALLQTPPYPMLLTVLPPGAAAALAAELAGRGHHPSAVNAAPESAAEFAAAWKERTGRARTALEADRDLLVAWLDAFHDEAAPPGPMETQQVVDDRLSFGGMVLWEHAGVPVSLAGRTKPAAGLARVGPVALNLRVHATGISARDVEDQIRRLGAGVLPRLRS